MTIKITVHKHDEVDNQRDEHDKRITIDKLDERVAQPDERVNRITLHKPDEQVTQPEGRDDQYEERGGRNKRLLAIVASCGTLALIAVIGLIGLQPWDSSSPATPQQTITITIHDMHFTVDRSSVSAGQPVTIMLENHDTMNHEFAISALGVSSPVVGPGATISVTFTPPGPGDYEYRCPMPGHADLGLVGILHVAQ